MILEEKNIIFSAFAGFLTFLNNGAYATVHRVKHTQPIINYSKIKQEIFFSF